MNESAVEKAWAKINLFLDVTGKRNDGYHEIRSVMQTVSFGDTVTVEKTAPGLSMTCSDPSLSCGEENLCRKAAALFYRKAGLTPACRIRLEKVIPREAGLGGGSADGAAVLRALNRLCGNPFSVGELTETAAALGADVPFCVTGGTALAEGIGEKLSPYPAPPSCTVVIADGIGKSATAAAYRKLDALPDDSGAGEAAWRRFDAAMRTGSLAGIGAALYNRFEDAVSDSAPVTALLRAAGAEGARMTGSGTAVFGLFSDPDRAAYACRILRAAGVGARVAIPV